MSSTRLVSVGRPGRTWRTGSNVAAAAVAGPDEHVPTRDQTSARRSPGAAAVVVGPPALHLSAGSPSLPRRVRRRYPARQVPDAGRGNPLRRHVDATSASLRQDAESVEWVPLEPAVATLESWRLLRKLRSTTAPDVTGKGAVRPMCVPGPRSGKLISEVRRRDPSRVRPRRRRP